MKTAVFVFTVCATLSFGISIDFKECLLKNRIYEENITPNLPEDADVSNFTRSCVAACNWEINNIWSSDGKLNDAIVNKDKSPIVHQSQFNKLWASCKGRNDNCQRMDCLRELGFKPLLSKA